MGLKFTKSKNTLYFLFLLPSLFFLFAPAKFPADDGFFYPQIAYHIVHGKGSYFNDLYLTNGYHPLWMLFCAMAESLNPFSKQDVVYILWGFQVILVSLSLKKLELFFENNFTGKTIAFFCIVILFFSLGTLYLTEAHLNLFCFALLIHFLATKSNNDWLFGTLFSLVFLSRLDNVFPLAILGIFYLNQRKWDYRVFVKSGLVVLLICGFYLLSNFYWFGGSLVPISGRIKSSFPHFQSDLFLGVISKFFLIVNALALLFYFLIKGIQFRSLKIYVALGSLVQLLYNIGFQSQIGQWYYVLQSIVLILLLGDFVLLIFKNRAKSTFLPYLAPTLGLIISCGIGYLKMSSNFSVEFTLLDKASKISDKKEIDVKTFAEDIKNMLPANSRIFTYDFPGKLAFYSDMNIIPADGLVANKDYFEEISEMKFSGFLKKNNIDYVNLPSAFNTTGECSFIGISTYTDHTTHYFIKNSMTKKLVDTIDLTEFRKIKSYKNPIKIWQKDYDSISVYQLVR